MSDDEQLMLEDISGVSDVEDAHVREVYARFGLAIYVAQCFEHGIVNAITFLDLIPNRRHLARSRTDWEDEVDGFMGMHFEKTMGALIKTLSGLTTLDPSFETVLRAALRTRNHLVHDFFRDRAADFMRTPGRHSMLAEIDDSIEKLKLADSTLAKIIEPIRNKFGITDALIENEMQKYLN